MGYRVRIELGIFCKGFWYEIINEIGGGEVGMRRYIEEFYVNNKFPLSRYQVYIWVSLVHLLP